MDAAVEAAANVTAPIAAAVAPPGASAGPLAPLQVADLLLHADDHLAKMGKLLDMLKSYFGKERRAYKDAAGVDALQRRAYLAHAGEDGVLVKLSTCERISSDVYSPHVRGRTLEAGLEDLAKHWPALGHGALADWGLPQLKELKELLCVVRGKLLFDALLAWGGAEVVEVEEEPGGAEAAGTWAAAHSAALALGKTCKDIAERPGDHWLLMKYEALQDMARTMGRGENLKLDSTEAIRSAIASTGGGGGGGRAAAAPFCRPSAPVRRGKDAQPRKSRSAAVASLSGAAVSGAGGSAYAAVSGSSLGGPATRPSQSRGTSSASVPPRRGAAAAALSDQPPAEPQRMLAVPPSSLGGVPPSSAYVLWGDSTSFGAVPLLSVPGAAATASAAGGSSLAASTGSQASRPAPARAGVGQDSRTLSFEGGIRSHGSGAPAAFAETLDGSGGGNDSQAQQASSAALAESGQVTPLQVLDLWRGASGKRWQRIVASRVQKLAKKELEHAISRGSADVQALSSFVGVTDGRINALVRRSACVGLCRHVFHPYLDKPDWKVEHGRAYLHEALPNLEVGTLTSWTESDFAQCETLVWNWMGEAVYDTLRLGSFDAVELDTQQQQEAPPVVNAMIKFADGVKSYPGDEWLALPESSLQSLSSAASAKDGGVVWHVPSGSAARPTSLALRLGGRRHGASGSARHKQPLADERAASARSQVPASRRSASCVGGLTRGSFTWKPPRAQAAAAAHASAHRGGTAGGGWWDGAAEADADLDLVAGGTVVGSAAGSACSPGREALASVEEALPSFTARGVGGLTGAGWAAAAAVPSNTQQECFEGSDDDDDDDDDNKDKDDGGQPGYHDCGDYADAQVDRAAEAVMHAAGAPEDPIVGAAGPGAAKEGAVRASGDWSAAEVSTLKEAARSLGLSWVSLPAGRAAARRQGDAAVRPPRTTAAPDRRSTSEDVLPLCAPSAGPDRDVRAVSDPAAADEALAERLGEHQPHRLCSTWTRPAPLVLASHASEPQGPSSHPPSVPLPSATAAGSDLVSPGDSHQLVAPSLLDGGLSPTKVAAAVAAAAAAAVAAAPAAVVPIEGRRPQSLAAIRKDICSRFDPASGLASALLPSLWARLPPAELPPSDLLALEAMLLRPSPGRRAGAPLRYQSAAAAVAQGTWVPVPVECALTVDAAGGRASPAGGTSAGGDTDSAMPHAAPGRFPLHPGALPAREGGMHVEAGVMLPQGDDGGLAVRSPSTGRPGVNPPSSAAASSAAAGPTAAPTTSNSFPAHTLMAVVAASSTASPPGDHLSEAWVTACAGSLANDAAFGLPSTTPSPDGGWSQTAPDGGQPSAHFPAWAGGFGALPDLGSATELPHAPEAPLHTPAPAAGVTPVQVFDMWRLHPDLPWRLDLLQSLMEDCKHPLEEDQRPLAAQGSAAVAKIAGAGVHFVVLRSQCVRLCKDIVDPHQTDTAGWSPATGEATMRRLLPRLEQGDLGSWSEADYVLLQELLWDWMGEALFDTLRDGPFGAISKATAMSTNQRAAYTVSCMTTRVVLDDRTCQDEWLLVAEAGIEGLAASTRAGMAEWHAPYGRAINTFLERDWEVTDLDPMAARQAFWNTTPLRAAVRHTRGDVQAPAGGDRCLVAFPAHSAGSGLPQQGTVGHQTQASAGTSPCTHLQELWNSEAHDGRPSAIANPAAPSAAGGFDERNGPPLFGNDGRSGCRHNSGTGAGGSNTGNGKAGGSDGRGGDGSSGGARGRPRSPSLHSDDAVAQPHSKQPRTSPSQGVSADDDVRERGGGTGSHAAADSLEAGLPDFSHQLPASGITAVGPSMDCSMAEVAVDGPPGAGLHASVTWAASDVASHRLALATNDGVMHDPAAASVRLTARAPPPPAVPHALMPTRGAVAGGHIDCGTTAAPQAAAGATQLSAAHCNLAEPALAAPLLSAWDVQLADSSRLLLAAACDDRDAARRSCLTAQQHAAGLHTALAQLVAQQAAREQGHAAAVRALQQVAAERQALLQTTTAALTAALQDLSHREVEVASLRADLQQRQVPLQAPLQVPLQVEDSALSRHTRSPTAARGSSQPFSTTMNPHHVHHRGTPTLSAARSSSPTPSHPETSSDLGLPACVLSNVLRMAEHWPGRAACRAFRDATDASRRKLRLRGKLPAAAPLRRLLARLTQLEELCLLSTTVSGEDLRGDDPAAANGPQQPLGGTYSALSACTHLVSLNLCRTKINDLTPLASLFRLRSLNLQHCYNKHGGGAEQGVRDLAPLSHCIHLTSLLLQGCRALRTLAPLSALTNLVSLDLKGCNAAVRDVAPLASCASLEALDCNGCPNLRIVAPLAACVRMTSLNLTGCLNISDLPSLGALTNLLTLDLSLCSTHDKPHRSIAFVASLVHLTSLDLLRFAALTDLVPLASCPRLATLNLGSCRTLVHLGPLASCAMLATLILDSCPLVADLTPLASCRQLATLAVSQCAAVADLSPLASCLALTALDLSHCAALAPLSGDKSGDGLACLAPLAACTALRTLLVDGCSAEIESEAEALRARLPLLGGSDGPGGA